jgi:hypothetical protein
MGRKLLSALCAVAAAALVSIAAPAFAQPRAEPNSCATCHATLADARLSAPANVFAGQDVHREKGFACVDCHGGNPTTGDKAQSHDVSGRSSAMAFRGKPTGQTVIATCARCHSDAEIMRTFAPKQRVDQATEYATSVHGKRLATGDTNVATCASCHGAHGVRMVSDAKSPVFPTNVATTCASCHADTKRMGEYKLPDGSPLPTHQFADYQKSIHFTALTKNNDLSAPTCNDCHGNHGAVPPGVGSIANICGTCHAVFAQKFEGSVHQQIFDKGCVECHWQPRRAQAVGRDAGRHRPRRVRDVPQRIGRQGRRGRREDARRHRAPEGRRRAIGRAARARPQRRHRGQRRRAGAA